MKVFKIFVVTIVTLFALFLIVTVFIPSRYSIERKIEIIAPQSVIYFLLNDFHNWKYWDTWWKLDTMQERNFTGPMFGLGSAFSWKSRDKNVGNGELKIIEEKPFEFIRIAMRFGREMQSDATFRLMRLDDDRVLVVWKMEGELKFIAKWFRYFLDEAVGKDFEAGLSNIKNLSEKIAKSKIYFFRDTFPEAKIIFISDSASNHPSEIQEKFADAFQELMIFANRNKLSYSGNPTTIYRSYSANGMTFDACIPVQSFDTLQPTGRIKFGTIPKTYVLRTVYLGDYRGLPGVYQQIQKYMQENKLAPKGNSFEMYYTDPEAVQPEENLTIIYFPI